MYCSGTRGPSRNPGPCSLKYADWRLLSLGLSVGDVGVGRAWGSVRSGASPRCSISRSSELGVGDVWGSAVGARLSPRRAVKGVETFVWQDKAPPLRGRIRGDLGVSAGPFVVGVAGFFPAGTHVGRVPDWLLVTRTLGAQDLVRIPLWGFLRASIPCSMYPLAGAAAWLGSKEEVGASDGMVATALSFVGRVLRHPHNAVRDEGAVVTL